MTDEQGRGGIEDLRFVTIEQCTISTGHKAKIRVQIKHTPKAIESFPLTQDAALQHTVDVKTCIDTAAFETIALRVKWSRFYIWHRAVEIPLELGNVYSSPHNLPVRRRNGLTVRLILGPRKTMADVALLRLNKAKAALMSKEGLMTCISTATENMDLVMEVFIAVSELNDVAKAVAGVAEALFENLQGFVNNHDQHKKHINEFITDLKLDEAAGKVFKTELVKEVSQMLIQLVIDACQMIASYYSKSKRELTFRALFRNDNELNDFIERIKECRTTVQRAFLIGIGDKLDGLQGGLTRTEAGVGTIISRMDASLSTNPIHALSPPPNSSFREKSYCLEGTRKSILKRIQGWAEGEGSNVFWVHGVAGCGKSSVAATVSKTFQRKDTLCGSFFLTRNDPARRDPTRVIRSIAHAFADVVPGFDEKLRSALRRVTHVLEESPKAQFERFVEEPLHSLGQITDVHQNVFVIDALDECDDESGEMARFLVRVAELAPWLRLLVTSRDQPQIRKSLTRLSPGLIIHDLFHDDVDGTHDDIPAFLNDEPSPYGSLSDLGPRISPEQRDSLVERAQGLFIYMKTVVNYLLLSDNGLGRDALDLILSGSNSASSEEALDEMYLLVLRNAAGHSARGKEIVSHILGFAFATSFTECLPKEALHAFLPPSIDMLDVQFFTVLHKLSPIFTPGPGGAVIPIHKSVLDFADSASRAQEFYIESDRMSADLAVGCLEIMIHGTRNSKRQLLSPSGLKFNICGLESSYVPNSDIDDLPGRIAKEISPELRYSCTFWLHHSAKVETGGMEEAFYNMLEEFMLSTRSLYWTEAMGLLGRLPTARSILLQISKLLVEGEDVPESGVKKRKRKLVSRVAANIVKYRDKIRMPTSARLSKPPKTGLSQAESITAIVDVAHCLRQLLDQFFHAISTSTPHLYTSALLWLSADSVLVKIWKPEFPQAGRISPPVTNAASVISQISLSGFVPAISLCGEDVFASGSADGYIKLWSIHDGRSLDRVKAHDGRVFGLAFSSGARQLASGSDDEKCIRLWDFEGCASLRAGGILEGHECGIERLAYSGNGSQLASGSSDKTIRLWDVKSGNCIRVIRGHTRAVTSLAFSPDDEQIVSGSYDKTVRIWRVENGQSVGEPLIGHGDQVWSVAFSREGTKVASGSSDRTVLIWDAKSRQQIGDPIEAGNWVFSVAFSRDGSTVIVGVTFCLQGWNVERRTQDWQIDVSVLRFSTTLDGARIVCGGTKISILDMSSINSHRRIVSTSPTRLGTILAAILASDKTSIMAVQQNTFGIRTWSTQTGETVKETALLDHGADELWRAAFSHDRKHVAAGDSGGSIWVWNTNTGKLIHGPLEGHTSGVSCVAFSPDDSKLLSGSFDQGLQVWDMHTGKATKQLLAGQPDVKDPELSVSADFSPTGTHIVSGCGKTIHIWDAKSYELVGAPLEVHDEVHSVAFSPDGESLAVGYWDDSVEIWNMEERQIIWKSTSGYGDPVRKVAFPVDKDGQNLFSGHDGTIRVWDTKNDDPDGALIATLEGHTSFIRSLIPSLDGTQLVSSSFDGTVRIWDTDSFIEADPVSGRRKVLGPKGMVKLVSRDGWIKADDGELLMWIPSAYCEGFRDSSLMCFPRQEELHRTLEDVVKDELYEGTEWTRIRKAPSNRDDD